LRMGSDMLQDGSRNPGVQMLYLGFKVIKLKIVR